MEESRLSAIECMIRGVSDVRQTEEVHTAEPLVREPSFFGSG